MAELMTAPQGKASDPPKIVLAKAINRFTGRHFGNGMNREDSKACADYIITALQNAGYSLTVKP